MNNENIIQKSKKLFKKHNVNDDNLLKYDIELKKIEFYNWCLENKFKYDKNFLFNFIEKMAIWYEMRYSNQVLWNIFYKNNISNEIKEYIKSKGIKEFESLLNENEKKLLEEFIEFIKWSDLFDFNTFYKTLDMEEKAIIDDPFFAFIYKFENDVKVYFDLTGNILEIEGKDNYIMSILKRCKDAKDIVNILMEFDLIEDSLNVYDLCKDYDNRVKFKEKLLDMVLYRIIERGNLSSGLERGYLFANEFKRDLSIPFKYISREPYHYKSIIEEYVKSGANLDFNCCMYYFSKNIEKIERKFKDIYLETIDTKTNIKKIREEIVNILNNRVLANQEIINQNELINKKLYKHK